MTLNMNTTVQVREHMSYILPFHLNLGHKKGWMEKLTV